MSINRCKQEAMKVFYELLKEYGDKLQRVPPSPPTNLSPPHEIYESINRLVNCEICIRIDDVCRVT